MILGRVQDFIVGRKMKAKSPLFLMEFDYFAALHMWASEGKKEEKRHWLIRQQGTAVAVELSWRFGESQLGGVVKLAQSPEEAVYLALKEQIPMMKGSCK